MNNLSGVLRSQGDVVSARALLQHVVAAYRRVLGESHPSTGVVLGNLASADEELGDLKGALTLYKEAAGILEQSLGGEHPSAKLAHRKIRSLELR
jgi:hypothetical protein